MRVRANGQGEKNAMLAMICHVMIVNWSHSWSPKPMTETAAWKREHESVNTTTRWDNYPQQVIHQPVASGKHDGVKQGVVKSKWSERLRTQI
jgi:hypothetical protein